MPISFSKIFHWLQNQCRAFAKETDSTSETKNTAKKRSNHLNCQGICRQILKSKETKSSWPFKKTLKLVHAFLKFLDQVTQVDYYDALSLSSGSDFQIHLKRTPNFCFVKIILMKKWKLGKQTSTFNQFLIIARL